MQEDAKRTTSGTRSGKEEVTLDQQHPISNMIGNFRLAAIDHQESIGNMIDRRLGVPSDMLPGHDARMSQSRDERVAQTAGQPFFGITDRSLGVRPGNGLSAHGSRAPELSPKWSARDFVARSAAQPVRSALCFPLRAGQGRSAVMTCRACRAVS